MRDYPEKSDGVFIPFECLGTPRRRDMTATTFGAGGALVQTSVPGEVIPLLRNQSVCERLGARVITGLEGNLGLPRQTSAAAVSATGEQGQAAGSNASLDQVLLSPHRISAYTNYTRQLMLQSSVDMDQFVSDDLNLQLALKIDSVGLYGQGGAEPTGIFNTTGIGSLTFGGTATWFEVQEFEQSLATANALAVPGARVGWATSPNVRTRWKAVAKTGVGVTSVVPVFLVDDYVYPDESQDTRCNGYRFASSNQILNNLVAFGNWNDLVIGCWGRGAELIVNPYSLATSGTVQVVINAFVDVALRRAQSFCVSQDSGAQ
jgi:hypothetical protein